MSRQLVLKSPWDIDGVSTTIVIANSNAIGLIVLVDIVFNQMVLL